MRIMTAAHDRLYAQHIVGLVDGEDGVQTTAAHHWRRRAEVSGDDFDLYHLHLGTQRLDVAQLRHQVAALRAHGIPLVVTAHQLRNLHQEGPGALEEALDLALPAAARVITLTAGAAAQIYERWGVRASVIPHPHVLPLDELEQPRTQRSRPTVGVVLGDTPASLYPVSLDPMPVLEVLREATAARGMELVTGFDRQTVARPAADQPSSAGAPAVAGSQVGQDWNRWRQLDLCVLPYRFGTHCRWVEACHDLGTRVLTPRLGFFDQQRPGVLSYHRRPDGSPQAGDIETALDHVLDELHAGHRWQATRLHRTAQRQRIASAHEQLYREVLGS